MSPGRITRRDFVKQSAGGAAALVLAGTHVAGAPAAGMLTRPLGRTGHHVKLFSLGGQATLEKPGQDDLAVQIINRAIDLGVNYLDTAAAYGGGISQKYLGMVMKTRRKEVFLATKTGDRTRDGALRHLETSLTSLQTDHLDLWQMHNVRTDEELEKIFGAGGVLEAFKQAREQKMVRFLGITGHYDPAVLLTAINRFEFDTILMALNAADRHRLSFIETLLPAANAKGMGVIAMKIPARGRIFGPGGLTSMKQALPYVLTLPVSTVIIGCDTVAHAEENISIAAGFQPLSAAEMVRIESQASGVQVEATFFKKDGAGFGRPGADDQQLD